MTEDLKDFFSSEASKLVSVSIDDDADVDEE